MKELVLFFLLVIMFWTMPVMAERRDGAVTIAPFFGGHMFSAGAEHLDDDFTMGIRAGYTLTRNLGAELIFGYTETLYDPALIRANVYRYGVDMLYSFRPESSLVPSLAAGFGAISVDSRDQIHDRTHPYLDYGCSINYWLNDWLALRGDFRHDVVFDGFNSNFVFLAGVQLQFGGD